MAPIRSAAAIERMRVVSVRRCMLNRCLNPKHPSFHYYGGRGITVCQRWIDSPQAFVDDMGPRPPGATLERIDNNAGYSPENCRWATRAEQNRNTRRNVHLSYRGRDILLADACAEAGLPLVAVLKRIFYRGWTVEDALETPVSRNNPRPKRGAAA